MSKDRIDLSKYPPEKIFSIQCVVEWDNPKIGKKYKHIGSGPFVVFSIRELNKDEEERNGHFQELEIIKEIPTGKMKAKKTRMGERMVEVMDSESYKLPGSLFKKI